STSLMILDQIFGVSEVRAQKDVFFVGDSPNDSLMFGFFNNSVGVANVANLLDYMDERPKYITSKHAGAGFVEVADFLLGG
ncbi:MAG: HAD family hydrolase, partial [Candidatus Thioglobus sp.]|nr:HAD family hydrolase [Candidatus Thioglobus sp.]